MKKLKKALQKVISTRLAKKAPLTKKKSAPVKAAAPKPAKKKAPVAKAAAPKKAADKAVDKKKVAAKAVAAPAPKKQEAPKGKKVLATAPAKKADKAPAAKAAAPAPAVKTKKAEAAAPAPVKLKPEAKAPKADKPKKSEEPKPVEAEAAAGDDGYDEEAEVFLTDAEGRRYCRTKDCDQVSMVDGYCRYHYLLFWKKIQVRKKILTEGKLERYIEELTARYPDKYLEMLRKDLRTEKDFTAAITELELDETAGDSEYEDSEAQSYLDEVRGVSGDSNTRDDDGDF